MKYSKLNLNKTVKFVLIVLLLNMVEITTISAQSFIAGNLNYSVNTDGVSVTVTGHVDGQNATGSLIIPETVIYEGTEYSVTSIGSNAFRYCCGLTGNLIIPNSVTSISIGAFQGCSGLTGDLTIPNSVTTIGDLAFQSCSGLTGDLIIPNSMTSIGGSAFHDCSGLTGDLIIPNSVTSIGGSAFSGCIGLTGDLIIPNSVTSIGPSAFAGCSGLISITIPNSITMIDNNVFGGCSGLTSITIPSSVTTIGYVAFRGCSGLTSITIPNSVTLIGRDAFIGCSGLTGDLIIPNSVTLIGARAFGGCSGLTSITIPNSVTSIGEETFSGCSGLTSITIPNSVTTIGNYAFQHCSGLTSITIPNSVTMIGNYAFQKCYELTSITIPNSVTSIGNYAFQNCYELTSITIPNSVTSIGNYAFSDCIRLEQILVESSNTVYDSRDNCNAIIHTSTNELIAGCKNTVIPNSVTSIGEGAFRGCIELTSIVIPNSVTSIGKKAFYNCGSSIIMLSITPPSMYPSFVSNTVRIYVPYESLSEYKTAANWNNYESQIYPWMQKSVAGYGESNDNWVFIASPLVEDADPTTVDNMITETAYDLYRFNQSVVLEWENYKEQGEHYHFALENGRGYLYANAEDVNLIFKGTFNENETEEVGLVYDAGDPCAGWNLVGNPFPVQAYANRSYYVMNENGTAIEPVAVSSEVAIEPCTGVMVKAEASETNPKVTFSKTAPDGQGNQGFMQIAVAQNNTRGTSTGSVTALDKAIVSFNEGDALGKFVFNEDNAKLWIPCGNEDLAIVCAEKTGEMPLNFRAKENGTYTISVNSEGVEINYLHLIDNLTGADVDLMATSDYTFTTKSTDYASRFRLVFSANDENGASTGSAAFAFVDASGNIIITDNSTDATLQIVDVMGRVIRSTDVARNVSTSGIPAGVYVLRLIDGNDIKTQKIVVE